MDDRSRSKLINQTCAPLFIGDALLADGHTATTSSATATFVRFQGKTYAVTCRHVRKDASAVTGWSARLHAGVAVIPLANWSSAGLTSILRDAADESGVDISLCRNPDHLFDVVSQAKPKTPIDLDTYEEPNWGEISFCLAAGFPDRIKTEQGGSVFSTMAEVVAEVTSNLLPSSETFVLHSNLGEPSPVGLSGMSGGPIFALREEGSPLPLGILFQGRPSGEVTDVPPGAFLTDADISIRGCLLSPTVFARWLQGAGL